MTTHANQQSFSLDRITTPIGRMLVLTDPQHNVRALDWEEYEARMLRLLRLHYGHAGFAVTEQRGPASVRAALDAYFASDLLALEALPVVTGGTAFQREVWAALRRIPVGQTTSYGELAVAIGRPSAVRAVGLANGANPVGVIVPCHRVIGANRALTGYAGGVARKHWLLQHEGVRLDAPRPLTTSSAAPWMA